jgi:UMP-CMP kinase
LTAIDALALYSSLVSFDWNFTSTFSDYSPGAPGAGKGTLSTYLAQEYSMMHYSVGDSLRNWMRGNRDAPLATQIRNKLDNQGFLSSEDLNPFLKEAIMVALNHEKQKYRGIIIDGFPRCIEQLESFDSWPFQDSLPLAPSSDGQVTTSAKPDIVLSLRTSKHSAKARYLSRGRDDNDSEDKFEKRFAEYERETTIVAEVYRRWGILVDVRINRVAQHILQANKRQINVDGTKDDNIAALGKSLERSKVWHNMIVEGSSGASFLVQDV